MNDPSGIHGGEVYRAQHPTPVDFIDRILLGIPDGSFSYFLSHFANGLIHHDTPDQFYGGVRFITSAVFHARWVSVTEEEFLRALANAKDLFACLLSRMVPHDLGKSEMPQGPACDVSALQAPILRMIAIILHHCSGKGTDILKTLSRSNIFETLELVLTGKDRPELAGMFHTFSPSEIYPVSLYLMTNVQQDPSQSS